VGGGEEKRTDKEEREIGLWQHLDKTNDWLQKGDFVKKNKTICTEVGFRRNIEAKNSKKLNHAKGNWRGG